MDKHNPISNEHIVANWVVVAQEEKEGVKEDPTIRGGISKDNPISNEHIVAKGERC